jgi:predicted kinase
MWFAFLLALFTRNFHTFKIMKTNNKLIKNNLTCIILRGVSGSGKTTIAEYLEFIATDNLECVICTADDFFYKDGEYLFDASKLGQAHEYCKEKAEAAMKENVGLVIIANTNTSEWEYKPYVQIAEENGYNIVSLVIENLHGNKNVHGVPDEVLEKQKNKLKNSIKL